MGVQRFQLPRLAELRSKQLLSQRQLAKKSGVGAATIARLETCVTQANRLTVQRLANALDLSFEQLVTQKEA